ncbi:SRPBCC domain-containing protein [Actinokineospora auranticolor]|uniref:Activator of Hsp90 ATPase-like protein n=1 Tax=Actinokineospora auranticolor TaxID=155976 RepID=A0A2S6GRG8_9PSEU|nr:SRPBCC domain-containing protein [Actinokineospora auranticolor]PPK67824.1 activator of Hsp90 ATPase-like protein [Actinokineospora auranticolor]
MTKPVSFTRTDAVLNSDVGRTRDAGWQVGVSKTVPRTKESVWAFLTSRDGVAIWLGAGAVVDRTTGARYTTSAGTTGETRSYRDCDRIRLTWQPRGWDHVTTVQVAISEKEGKTTIRFHQEWLANAVERAQQRVHWQGVMEAFTTALAQR